MDLIANNVANMSTPGYRGQNIAFREYLVNQPIGGPRSDTRDKISMVEDYAQYQYTAPGPLRETGNPLDVALNGTGYMGVQTGQGVLYTRAGNFRLNANGELITGAGDLVASDGGGAITIPREARQITISKDGSISTETGIIGRLMIVEFENEQNLEPTGRGLYKATAAANPAENTQVVQGAIEDSNVQPVVEMTRMIDVLRSYQEMQRMVQSEHERERTMIQRMTRS